MDDQIGESTLFLDLSRLPWTKGLKQEAIEEIAESSEYLHFAEGDWVHRAGDELDGVYFVTRGRVWASVIDLFGKVVLERPLTRGGCFGLFAIGQEESSIVNVGATEPTSLVKIEFDELHRLAAKHREFQFNLYKLAGSHVRKIVNVDRKKDLPSVVAIVHQTPGSRKFTRQILQRLVELDERPGVASDVSDWQHLDGVEHRTVIENGTVIDLGERKRQMREWSDRSRIILDVSASLAIDSLDRGLNFADTVLWCLRVADLEEAKSILRRLENRVVGYRDKLCLVWLLDGGQRIAPQTPELNSMVDRTFKVSFDKPEPNQGNLLNHGLERVVHHLRGIRIGIALGGGAARGMAHLGVLKALEENGIHVDMLAGTSAGAMTGTVYTHGMSIDHCVDSFKNDLRLPWIFRHMPGGGYWYLLYKYRRGQFDPMLRKYLGEAKLDQLAIPTYTVTVDLVSGAPVIRERQDAVRSILESINLPGLSSPILGEQEALVDGGLVNNIPADVLVAKGCNFVIASSVTSQLEQEFCGIRRGQQNDAKQKRPSTLQVLMRGQLVQSTNMNAVGVQPADMVIAPDVTAFDLSEFERTDEMAKIGEQTMLESLSGVRQLLSRLDNQLFPV